jgi:hypothetical protein
LVPGGKIGLETVRNTGIGSAINESQSQCGNQMEINTMYIGQNLLFDGICPDLQIMTDKFCDLDPEERRNFRVGT